MSVNSIRVRTTDSGNRYINGPSGDVLWICRTDGCENWATQTFTEWVREQERDVVTRLCAACADNA